ncbi:sensor N-terminal transmembrane domain-containing protein [Altererythrobacter sp. KTW20L]|uniref:stimulus-sensing domain-containing protein n=1 Tax=Altererythrobacter sp. KTW20L TaxID=2942210 RepID=UPI0020C1186D|nr:stimulus-sensing domain-containing protein [Altererythrobacter sp. KTW20L]MCL6249574.1 sensor N-terminal transmembrane domain-containing protein [Altererythrobacter sp. KTW20L]
MAEGDQSGAQDQLRAGRLERLAFPLGASLTTRILAVNLIPLLVLAGGLFFLDSYRRQLLDERYKLARIEAQITAEALAGATRQRQEALLIQIGKEQRMRLRMYDAEGELWADSFVLAEPSFRFDDPVAEPFVEDFARWTDKAVNFAVGAPAAPRYVEPDVQDASAWPELVRAREQGRTQIELRLAPDDTPVINAAAPVGLNGVTLLTTRNAVDITQSVRNARTSLLNIIAAALLVSIVLSLYLASTIIQPLRRLVRAAVLVRSGRERDVEVPRMAERSDEIGVLARAVSDMTATLRLRIDAVESFAADVAHEIKNPLASLRSATESLPRVKDPALARQLVEIAAHDVQRIDRLVSEISEASRVDAEISRTRFELVDMAQLFANIIAAREDRGENAGCSVQLVHGDGGYGVMGVPLRLERIAENLLDNAVSFSPPGGEVLVTVGHHGGSVVTAVSDQGPGIPAEARELVFRRFHSDRPDADGFGNHSGLGLAIARTIAEAHNGSLVVEDRADGHPGARLVLDLPAA